MSRGVLLAGRDLPGLQPAPGPVGILDTRAHRNRGQPRLRKGRALPDDVLVATLVHVGCPRWFAEELRLSEQLRFQAAAVYFLAQDAAAGRHRTHPVTGEPILAKDLLDLVVSEYLLLRDVDMVADQPDMSAGFFER